MNLHELIDAASALSDDELQELDFWIRNRLDPAAAEIEHHRRPESTEEREDDEVTYRLKYFRCGKPTCRCWRGQLHGPYLYIHRRHPGGRTSTTYMGRIDVIRQDEDRQLELDLH